MPRRLIPSCALCPRDERSAARLVLMGSGRFVCAGCIGEARHALAQGEAEDARRHGAVFSRTVDAALGDAGGRAPATYAARGRTLQVDV